MECREVRELLAGHLDEELDPATSRSISTHMSSCAGCAAALESQRRVRDELRRGLEYHRAPASLRAQVRRELADATPRTVRAPALGLGRALGWIGAAAAFVLVAGGAWLAGSSSSESSSLTGEIVASHVRSLMASHLTDVASTDQHTVKPWFAGKLDFSPPVTDFAAQGYPLVGGRLEYVHGRAAAALVYERRRHVINVFIWPTSGGGQAIATPATRQGFHVIEGREEGMALWIVSDLNEEELSRFARLLIPPGR